MSRKNFTNIGVVVSDKYRSAKNFHVKSTDIHVRIRRWQFSVSGYSCRQSKIKYAAATRLRLDPNLSAVQLHKGSANCESEAGAFGLYISHLGDLVELIKNLFSFVRRYAQDRYRTPKPERFHCHFLKLTA